MKAPITLPAIEFIRLSPSAKKSAKAYIKYRVRALGIALEKSKAPPWSVYSEFLHGRYVEAVQILEMIQYLENGRGKK
jgi:hypothetical protein